MSALPSLPQTSASPSEKITSANEDSPVRLTLLSVERQDRGARHGSRDTWIVASLIVFTLTATGIWFLRSPNLRGETLAKVPGNNSAVPALPRIYALGRIEPTGEVIAVAGPDGASAARIRRMDVKEGDTVEADRILAVFDNEERLLAERQTAERRVRRAEAVVAQTRRLVESTRRELLASLEIARATLVNDRRVLERLTRLDRSNSTTKSDLELAQLQAESSQQKIVEIQSRLIHYEAEPGEEPVDVLVALEDLEVAKGSLREAETRLEQAYLRAPVAGTVLDLHKRAGEPVGSGPILDFGATEKMDVRIDVYETDAQRIRIGQSVWLNSSALAHSLQGDVSRISPLVKRQSIVDATPAANTDARVIEVVVRLSDEASEVARKYIGLQVRAEFVP
ncbi:MULTISPECIES: HlyD family efflux transporter periplasmic adaptor subunit [unclassified Schlesneria]|uniref:HlyD family efflux transporter periplasmic adaptor subunit n=1 Tax=unclassified Schlesneria TaxID=2762017 RepID=UPI002F1824E5